MVIWAALTTWPDTAPHQWTRGMGLGSLILREIACMQTILDPKPYPESRTSLTMPTRAKLKICKERRHATCADPRTDDDRARHMAATAIAALSVSWAPGAGIAKGFPPTSREATEIAHIKQDEWVEYEPKRLWQARNAWTSWAKFAKSRGYPDSRDAPSNLVIVWLNNS